MILILLFLVIIYFIIKTNKNNKQKHVKFSEIVENYEIPRSSDDSISFYSKSWYSNNYLENSHDKNLKNIYDQNKNIKLNPIPEDEKSINNIKIESNQKIKDIYDKYVDNFNDYEKKKLDNSLDDGKIMEGASKLSYYTSDLWNYENENIMNGGNISNNLTAYDSISLTNTALF
jgi:hypothetical protein